MQGAASGTPTSKTGFVGALVAAPFPRTETLNTSPITNLEPHQNKKF